MGTELIRAFEPILYFHKDEMFFPSDAKRYLEYSSLWSAEVPFDDQTSWGGKGNPFPRQPLIAGGHIAAFKNELRTPDLGGPDTFLGEEQTTGFPFLASDDKRELFLSLSGWQDNPGDSITPTSPTKHAALDWLAELYNGPKTTSTDLTVLNPALQESRFWYHAEEFSPDALKQMAGQAVVTSVNRGPFLDQFTEPHLICYYLFFPGHIEGIPGCFDIPSGAVFGNFAGEWASIVILLDRVDQELRPLFLGLASRSSKDAIRKDDEKRVAMSIIEWAKLTTFTDAPQHVRVFVGLGTHSLYLEPGPTELKPLNPLDPAYQFCGSLEEWQAWNDAHKGAPGHLAAAMLKAVSGLVFGLPGELAGMAWGLMEDGPLWKDSDTVHSPPAPSLSDQAPAEGDFGNVIHPIDFVPPDVGGGTPIPWPVQDTIMDPFTRRTYSIIVDRRTPNEDLRQIWWPGVQNKAGYLGRWGPRVSQDPSARRAGMKFPDFAGMFLDALLQFES
jgi:hypothetical protein